MYVEITGYKFTNGILKIYATRKEKYGSPEMEYIAEKENDFKFITNELNEQEVTFIFEKDDLKYLYSWLKRQVTAKACLGSKLGIAVNAVVGTRTTISSKYLEVA